MPMTSPVERISGPERVGAGKRPKGHDGLLHEVATRLGEVPGKIERGQLLPRHDAARELR